MYYTRTYPKEERWEFRYKVGGDLKFCYPRSKEQIESNRKYCAEHGYTVISVKKLYPFNTEKNQHNIELIHCICVNRLHDMDIGDTPYDEKRYDDLCELQDRADNLRGLPLPVAWLPYEVWKEAKEISMMAVEHRMGVCIENGRYDLLKYC